MVMEVRGQGVSVISFILLPHGDGNTDTSDPNIDILPHRALLGWKSSFIALIKKKIHFALWKNEHFS